MSSPLTVLMPAYNAADFIGEAIASVLKQDYSDFEFLIIDDGSTDQTAAIINSFNDPRIRCIRHSANRGIAAALNTGIEAASGKYIARFDADDICHPSRLGIQFRFMEEHPSIAICGTAASYVNMDGEPVFPFMPPAFSDDAIRELPLMTCPFIHASVMYRRSAVVEAGKYDIHAHAFEDHLLWLNMLRKHKGCNLPEKLVSVRLNPASVSIDETWRGKRFLSIKKKILLAGKITPREGTELEAILRKQDTRRIKEGSYHALVAKKYLWNNFQPVKARASIRRSISQRPWHWPNYGLLLLSFLPQPLILKIYKTYRANK